MATLKQIYGEGYEARIAGHRRKRGTELDAVMDATEAAIKDLRKMIDVLAVQVKVSAEDVPTRKE